LAPLATTTASVDSGDRTVAVTGAARCQPPDLEVGAALRRYRVIARGDWMTRRAVPPALSSAAFRAYARGQIQEESPCPL
jgi:hypothetical protein